MSTSNSALNIPALSSNGQLWIGSGSGNPTAATLTAGTGISVTNGSNTITLAATGATTWVDQTGTSVTMSVNTNYIADNASLVTLTIPATAALGDTFRIVGKGAGGWLVQANTGQTIHMGTAASSSAGSMASSNQYDCITFSCVTANTTFVCYGAQGFLTLA